MTTNITISISIYVPIHIAWAKWTTATDIVHWNFASPDWQCPAADNDLRQGGKFNYRMEAKDGSFGFNFCGTYLTVNKLQSIHYLLDDNRNVNILFEEINKQTIITQTFEAENENPIDMQQQGWQMIMNNFKHYAETI